MWSDEKGFDRVYLVCAWVWGRVRFDLERAGGDTLCIAFDMGFVLAYFIRWRMLGFEAFELF